jgi:hypothetical protein
MDVIYPPFSGGGGGGSVTEVNGTPNQIRVVDNTTTPVVSFDNALNPNSLLGYDASNAPINVLPDNTTVHIVDGVLSVIGGASGNVLSDGTGTNGQIPMFLGDAFNITPSPFTVNGTSNVTSTLELIAPYFTINNPSGFIQFSPTNFVTYNGVFETSDNGTNSILSYQSDIHRFFMDPTSGSFSINPGSGVVFEVDFTGQVTAGGNLLNDGSNGALFHTIVPAATDTYDLGATGNIWNNIFASNAFLTTVNNDGSTLTTGGDLVVTDNLFFPAAFTTLQAQIFADEVGPLAVLRLYGDQVTTFFNVLDDGAGNSNFAAVLSAETRGSAQIDLTNDGSGNSQINFNNGTFFLAATTDTSHPGLTTGGALSVNTSGSIVNNAFRVFNSEVGASGDNALFVNTFNFTAGTVGNDLIIYGSNLTGYSQYFTVISQDSASNKGNVSTLNNILDDGISGASTWGAYLDVHSIVAPTAPATGYARIFSSIDGGTGFSTLSFINDNGDVFPWGVSGGGGTVTEIDTTIALTVGGVPGASITTSGEMGINPAWLFYDGANVVFGGGAGNNTYTGTDIASFGQASGQDLTSGSSNSFFGAIAGIHVTSGSYNTFMGESAGGTTDTQNYNSGFGRHALWLSNGNYNTALGAHAGQNIFTTDLNTFLGYNANIAGSGTANPGISNAAAIGANSVVNQANTYSYGDGTINHGFGTQAAQATLHVMGTTLVDDTGVNDYANNNAPQTGLLTGQAYLQTTGTGGVPILTIPVPNSGLAASGSMTSVEVTILAMDALFGTNGAGYATSQAFVWYDSTAVNFIPGTPPITFTGSPGYSTASASWSISGSNLILSVAGAGSTTNWVVTYKMFSSSLGLTP